MIRSLFVRGEDVKKIHLFIDDSGRLDKNCKYFVYAGYCFIEDSSKNKAKSRYKKLVKEIAEKNNFDFELKASNLSNKKHKNALYKILSNEISFSVVVENEDIKKQEILQEKRTRQRFKDYSVRRIVKNLLECLINKGRIDPNEDMHLFVNIDQQGFATNGLYGLGDGIREECKCGISNFNYGMLFKPIVFGEFEVETKSCVSSNDFLIQAADILANRIWKSYILDEPSLRKIPNHTLLLLP